MLRSLVFSARSCCYKELKGFVALLSTTPEKVWIAPQYEPSEPPCRTMKIDSPQFQSLFTPELTTLTDIFKKYKHEIRFAGGAVRDLLMDIQPHDIDLATTASPDEMHDMFNKEGIRILHTKGEQHGTVHCRINDTENFEVTALRVDILCDGRHAQVEFTTDWYKDANRRDLTINSIFLGLDGTVYDYFNGIEDLNNRKVRFVGSAEQRIKEDYLRIFRYFRFYGRIAREPFEHETCTLDAIRNNKDGLLGISKERIWSELKQIVVGRFGSAVLKVMLADCNLKPYLCLPDSTNIDRFGEVYERCYNMNPQSMTVIPALVDTEDQVYEMAIALKMSNNERLNGIFVVKHRDAPELHRDPGSAAEKKYLQDLFLDQGGTKEVHALPRTLEVCKYLGRVDLIEHMTNWPAAKFPIDGKMVILDGGVRKGPAVKAVLTGLYEAWKASDYKLTQPELMAMIPELYHPEECEPKIKRTKSNEGLQ